MNHHDLCVAWTAQQDAPFVARLEAACRARGLSVLQATPLNRDLCVEQLAAGSIGYRCLVDRASDEDPAFLPLVTWAGQQGARSLNPYARSRRAADKGATHQAIAAHLPTPATIVVPPYAECPDLGDLDLGPLGPAVTIKPAHGGGGDGVVLHTTTANSVQEARRRYPDDRYLLQAHVVPAVIGGRPAWFRVIYAVGRVYPFWWDPQTHVYTPVTVAEENHHGLRALQDLAARIASICGLGLFSTEIARQPDGSFSVVDYVNDPIDLTPESILPNGVPDQALDFIAEDLAAWAASRARAAAAG